MTTRLPICATITVALSLLVLVACESRPPIDRIEDGRIETSAELIAALESGDAEGRSRAALAMGRIQSPSYAGALARAAGARIDAHSLLVDPAASLGARDPGNPGQGNVEPLARILLADGPAAGQAPVRQGDQPRFGAGCCLGLSRSNRCM